jgi:hypothetical protein
LQWSTLQLWPQEPLIKEASKRNYPKVP